MQDFLRPGGKLVGSAAMYLDLWHGSCRKVLYAADPGRFTEPKFTLRPPYDNFTAILLGNLDSITAMMTGKLHVEGSFGYMMRNVPTVLDFVRCDREITTEVL